MNANKKYCQKWVGYYYVGDISIVRWWLHKLFCATCRDMQRHIDRETDWIGMQYDQNV